MKGPILKKFQERKRMAIILLVLLFLLPASTFFVFALLSPTPGKTLAREFTVQDIAGKNFSLKDFRGKIVVLDFMATWCNPCIIEIGHLKALSEKYGRGISIISLSVDPNYDTVEHLEGFVEEQGILWIVARDTQQVSIDYGVVAIPTMVIIDEMGYVRFRYEGLTDVSALSKALDQLLEAVERDREGIASLRGVSPIYAFTAGILSLLNPCGFALLPAYVVFRFRDKASIPGILLGSLASTLGLLTVFILFGAFASLLGSFLRTLFSWLNVLVATLVTVLGLTIFLGIHLPYLRQPKAPREFKGLLGLYALGLAYGTSASGCSAPIFISILLYAMTEEWHQSLITMASYTLGMGAFLIAIALLIASAKTFILLRIGSASPWIQKAGSIILIAFGLYMLYSLSTTPVP